VQCKVAFGHYIYTKSRKLDELRHAEKWHCFRMSRLWGECREYKNHNFQHWADFCSPEPFLAVKFLSLPWRLRSETFRWYTTRHPAGPILMGQYSNLSHLDWNTNVTFYAQGPTGATAAECQLPACHQPNSQPASHVRVLQICLYIYRSTDKSSALTRQISPEIRLAAIIFGLTFTTSGMFTLNTSRYKLICV
jgi:hypothetical protein